MHFFVHIPKTAGTSFRLAAEREFSPQRVVYDYGAQSPVTSPCIQQYLYGEGDQDKAALYAHCREHGVKLFAGHRPATRFLDGVGVGNIITFVREPLERVFSQYLHFKRHQGFEGSFREFFSVPSRRNGQANMLRGIPLRALGFVGITERYRQSLRMINQRYGWRLRHKRANRSGFFTPGPDSVSQVDRQNFYELNSDDCRAVPRGVLAVRYPPQARGRRPALRARGNEYDGRRQGSRLGLVGRAGRRTAPDRNLRQRRAGQHRGRRPGIETLDQSRRPGPGPRRLRRRHRCAPR